MKEEKRRNDFLNRVKRHKHLDGADKSAIAEAVLLQSLKSHQRTAERLIGFYFKARPE